MLIRITGGVSGKKLKEYLETGEKQGRDQTRDELDERIILSGDLEFTTYLIDSMDTEGERFLHVTLSFKEDEVDIETLRAINEDFREFTFAAYGDDEFDIYSEAHLPKIKSYINKQNGEFVERKPHIHFGIPKVNLVSGGGLNPFGMVDKNKEFIDAFQEYVNAKYGLASPKDNRRIKFTESSEIISRFQGAIFEGRGDDLKLRVLTTVLDRKIESADSFRDLLAEFGEVKVRNFGKPNEYINVKAPGSIKGTNLMDEVFSPSFIALSTTKKQEALTERYGRKGDVQRDGDLSTSLSNWRTTLSGDVSHRKDLKSQILGAVLDRKIETIEKFRELLSEFGETRTRNSGKKDEYESVKPAGSAKGINLKDYVFGKDFIELSTNEKRAAISGQIDRKYESAVAPKQVSGEHNGKIAEWLSTRAREIKHINSGNRKLYQAYRDADVDGKERILSEREALFDRKYRGPIEAVGAARAPVNFRGVIHESNHQQHLAEIGSLSSAGQLSDLHDLSGSDLVHNEVRRDMHVHGNETQVVVDQGTDQHHGMRRPDQSAGSGSSSRRESDAGLNPSTGRRCDSMISQLCRDLREETARAANENAADFATIKKEIDASQLLVALSKSHGLIPEKYSVSKASDGSDRIKCGTRNLNVSDFLTKEMNLPWVEASTILRAAHARQLEGHRFEATPTPLRQPKPNLWAEFAKTRPSSNQRSAEWEQLRQSKKERQQAITSNYYAEKAVLAGSPTAGKRAAMSLLRMEKLRLEAELRDQFNRERDALKTKQKKSASELYRDWLHAQAETGREAALEELRRVRVEPFPTPNPDDASINGKPQNTPLYESLNHVIHRNGDVTYLRNNEAVLRDTARAVNVIQNDRDTIEAGLRLAMAKFGSKLEITGSQEFKETAARIAAQAGLRCEFDDPALNKVMQDERAGIEASRLSIQQGHVKTVERKDGPTNDQRRQDKPVDIERRKERITDKIQGEEEGKAAEQATAKPKPVRMR